MSKISSLTLDIVTITASYYRTWAMAGCHLQLKSMLLWSVAFENKISNFKLLWYQLFLKPAIWLTWIYFVHFCIHLLLHAFSSVCKLCFLFTVSPPAIRKSQRVKVFFTNCYLLKHGCVWFEEGGLSAICRKKLHKKWRESWVAAWCGRLSLSPAIVAV